MFAVGLSVLLTAAAEAAAQHTPVRTVYVRGEMAGGGITRPDGGRCYVISVNHVVRGVGNDEDHVPDSLFVVANHEGEIKPDLLEPRYHYAVMRLPTESSHLCMAWPRIRQITNRINALPDTGTIGYISNRMNQGEEEPEVAVRVRRYNDMFVAIASLEGNFATGMSGGVVQIDGMPIALVEKTCDFVSNPDQTPTCFSEGFAYRLDEINDRVYPLLRSEDPPSSLQVYGSIFVPGLGQHATRRWRRGVAWAGATALTVAAVSQISETRTEMRTFDDPSGIPRLYPYRVREYRYQKPAPLAAVWLLGGVLSALEARKFVHDEYTGLDPDPPPATPTAALRVAPRAIGVDGAAGLALSVELTF